MTMGQIRIKGYERLLNLLTLMISGPNAWSEIKREALSVATETPDWMVTKTLLMLEGKGYLEKHKDGHGSSEYKRIKPFTTVTATQMHNWVTEYNKAQTTESRNRRKMSEEMAEAEF